MNRRMMALGMIALTASCLTSTVMAQQAAQSDPYQGVSQPPNDPITTSPDTPPPAPRIAKPAAGVVAASPAPVPQPSSAGPAPGPGYAAADPGLPALNARPEMADPDGDIVHPLQAPPGELMAGTTIRVKLMERLSSTDSEKGEPFHGQVATDVLQDGKVLIPAGASIEGRVSSVTSGEHLGGHGSFRLQPEAVFLPDGTRFKLHAETTGAPGSKARIGSEGSINPGSRAKKDGIEYGAVVGTGAVTGAVIGGPVGALTGSLIGAGVVTTHLMVSHPQATLEPGATLLFTLTEPLNLMPASN
jgi:hypothetical protein